MQDEFDDFDRRQLPPSKSQLKREMSALQVIGEKLVAMHPAQLEKLPIDSRLLDAVLLAQKIRNTREGFRRQLQYIGKLMRALDTEELEQAMAEFEQHHESQNAHFHLLELHRDAILAQGDDAIQVFLNDYPTADRQKLRQLYRQAQKEQQQNKPPTAARELFKYIRSLANDV